MATHFILVLLFLLSSSALTTAMTEYCRKTSPANADLLFVCDGGRQRILAHQVIMAQIIYALVLVGRSVSGNQQVIGSHAMPSVIGHRLPRGPTRTNAKV